MNTAQTNHFFGTQNIWKVLFKIAPPVMLAQLIQALYNIVDSYFIGQYSGHGLTTLSVIFPIQLIITALSVGTGVGVNTVMSKYYALNEEKNANYTASVGMFLAIISWVIFSCLSMLLLKFYIQSSAEATEAINYGISYGTIICIGSIAIFLESIWSKVHQAKGNMLVPMIAQVIGALINFVLDPVLIFGFWFIPSMGIVGAAIATIIGQAVAAIITGIKGFKAPPKLKDFLKYTKNIYQLGFPAIFMQIMFTVYIIALNFILVTFSDAAVTVLGLYYKIQTFFFIPLFALQTCIVPVLSYNYAQRNFLRVEKTLSYALIISIIFMSIGIICFEFLPEEMISIFSKDLTVLAIGKNAFRIIGLSFIPVVFSLMLPVYFQAIGDSKKSIVLSITRQIICLVPIFWLLSLIGLDYTWFAFPLAEVITGCIGIILYYIH